MIKFVFNFNYTNSLKIVNIAWHNSYIHVYTNVSKKHKKIALSQVLKCFFIQNLIQVHDNFSTSPETSFLLRPVPAYAPFVARHMFYNVQNQRLAF